jgi:hypothetical protein
VSVLRRWAERSLYALETRVARHPTLAQPLARLRGEGVLVERGTDLLIESFPRSASSFAVAAFEMAQEAKRDLRVAHHVHTPAHVMVAVRLGVPALVLIREPEDIVVSHVIRRPSRTVQAVLQGYLRFYEPLLPYREGFVVGTFGEVVNDFGTVIRRINARFGTTFGEFENTEENVERCLKEIDAEWRRRRGSSTLEWIVPRPSEAREALKPEIRERYRSEASRLLRQRAERVFNTFSSGTTLRPSE